MDIISAYREVGTYRGAAQICATTHKTVRQQLRSTTCSPSSRRIQGSAIDRAVTMKARVAADLSVTTGPWT